MNGQDRLLDFARVFRSSPERLSQFSLERVLQILGRAPARAAALVGACITAASTTADAAELQSLSGDSMAQHGEFAGVAIILGLVLFSTVTALLHLFGRRRWTDREQKLVHDLFEARSKLDRAQILLAAEPQVIVAWRSATDEPDIEGDFSIVADAAIPRRILGFGSWLPPEAAQSLDRAVDRLRNRGEAFRMATSTRAGRHIEIEGRAISGSAVLRMRDIEIEGRAISGSAVLRMRDLSGDRLELTRLREQHGKVLNELDAHRQLMLALTDPAWTRDGTDRLTWVNGAYARAVEAADPNGAVVNGLELFDTGTRAAATMARRDGRSWQARAAVVVAGKPRVFDVTDVPGTVGSIGVAFDRSDLVAAQTNLGRQAAAYAQILDRLTTAVAIFDASKRLQFHNAAYRTMWSLPAAFLDTKPFDGEILDRLRAEGKLPEQANFRSWKNAILANYQQKETVEQPWYLPNGRRLRVVTSPSAEGGLTYLFDDTTERYQLESSFNALTRVQGETLDSLREGVAVFGTDGRLKLFNPAFGTLWRLEDAILSAQPHIDDVIRLCGKLCEDRADIATLRTVVAGLAEERRVFKKRIARSDGMTLDCTAVPLPDGGTLVTFTDVTDSVSIERFLTEKNEALVHAEQLRNDFVHHVSYELRSPLTNIIGFVELLGDRAVGDLNAKQREYAGYVLKSSAALLAIINDILDLATIDMDALELSVGNVDILDAMREAAKGVQDRLADNKVSLSIVAQETIGSFKADGKRVRQILFNLLSNAIGFSEDGQQVTLAALRRDDLIVFKVTDQGRGIPLDALDKIFDRFHSATAGSRHRGVGLGLSIVRSLMQLHGGQVLIDSALGEGTTVTCIFPLRREAGDIDDAPATDDHPAPT